MTTRQPIPTDTSIRYGGLFRRTLGRAVRKSIDDVKAHRYTVPDDVRIQAWHMLKLLFEGDELWEETSQLLIELAPRMEMAGFRQDWIPFLEVGIARGEELGDAGSKAKLLYYVGQLYRMMGLYDEASSQFDESEAIFASLDVPNWQAMVLNERAYIIFIQGDYLATQTAAARALKLFDDAHIERAMSHYHLGISAQELSDMDTARAHYLMALKIRRTYDDKRWIAGGLRNLGILDTWEKRYADAHVAFEEAMQIHNVLYNPSLKASTLISLGILMRQTNQYIDAIGYYHQAREIYQQLSNEDSLATIYNNLGMTYKDLEMWHEAIEHTKTSIHIRRHRRNPFQLANSLDTLGEIYMAQGNYQQAMDKFEEALQQIHEIPKASSTRLYKSINTNIQELKNQM